MRETSTTSPRNRIGRYECDPCGRSVETVIVSGEMGLCAGCTRDLLL